MKATFTTLVKKSNKIKSLSFFDYLPAFIANVFSVIFSTSIILELRNIVNGYVLILLAIFIILFLIQNEIIKVKEVRKLFSGNRNSLLPFLITFLLSVSLASIGMYFFTNKASEIKDQSAINKTIEINIINSKFQSQIDEINNLSFDNSQQYKNINTEIKYWKSLTAATLEERNQIRTRIEKSINLLNDFRVNFDKNKEKQLKHIEALIENEKTLINAKYTSNINKTEKNNFITYIFLILIIITEFATLILNKNIAEKRNYIEQYTNSKLAKTYLTASNLLSSLYLSAKDNWININMAKYSPANDITNVDNWNEIKAIYNNFISLGIFSTGEIRTIGKNTDKGILFNELLLSESEANAKLNEYYERFFNVM